MGALNFLAGLTRYPTTPDIPVEYSHTTLGLADPWPETADPYSVATAMRCMQIIASAVAGCPIKAIHRETLEEAPIDALRPQVIEGPSPYELIETMVLHLAGWGNAYARKQREGGQTIGLGIVHPAAVGLSYDKAAARAGLPTQKRYTLPSGDKLTSTDMLHIVGPSDNGVEGLSVVSRAARVLSAARESDKTAEKLGKQGLRIPGILTTDQKIGAEQADIVQERWTDRTAGAANAGKVPVLSNGLSFKPIDMSPADAQFLESRRFNVSEIARLFGVPGWMINDQEKSTSWGTGMEQQFISFVTLTLKPYMQRIERRITHELLDHVEWKAEFSVEGLLRGDSKARASFYQQMTLIGAMTPNDVRAKENMPPVSWGDEPYRPYNQPATSTPTEGESNDSEE